MKTAVLIVLLLCGLSAVAEQRPLQTAKVISQQVGAYNGGAVVMPMGTGLIGVPITRRSNIVVIETARHRITLSELANKHFLVVPVNGTVSFFTDKNLVVMLDSNNKKHKFTIIHLEDLPQPK